MHRALPWAQSDYVQGLEHLSLTGVFCCGPGILRGFCRVWGCPRRIRPGVGERLLVREDEFPAHLLLTPSGGQMGSPAAAEGEGRGRPADGGIYIQLRVPFEAGSSPWRLVRLVLKGLGGWLCYQEAEHTRVPAHTHTHTGPQRTPDLHRIHKQLHPRTHTP